MSTIVHARLDIEEQYKWNAESVFPSVDRWQASFQQTEKLLETVKGSVV
jgi:oligoendopeptidase F